MSGADCLCLMRLSLSLRHRQSDTAGSVACSLSASDKPVYSDSRVGIMQEPVHQVPP